VVKSLRGVKVVSVAAGTEHMLCVTDAGDVYSWGGDANGCLGLGLGLGLGAAGVGAAGTRSTLLPTKVPSICGAVSVDCDNNASAAILSDGTLLMWGDNRSGRLGLGDTTSRPVPTAVPFKAPNAGAGAGAGNAGRTTPPTVRIAQVSVGSLYTGAVTTEGTLFTWGYGGHGNLGHGSRKSVHGARGVLLKCS
jgi:alpha-tubulin suppressor-like RCC1 family protein